MRRLWLRPIRKYFEGKPYLDRIIYRIIPDSSLSEMELLTRGIDYYGV